MFTGVETFNPKDKALDVIAKLRAFGMSDPKLVTGGAVTKSANIDIAPGSESQLVQIGGPLPDAGARFPAFWTWLESAVVLPGGGGRWNWSPWSNLDGGVRGHWKRHQD